MQNVDRNKVRIEERGQEEENDPADRFAMPTKHFKVEKTVTPQGTQASIVASPNKEAHDPVESPGLDKG